LLKKLNYKYGKPGSGTNSAIYSLEIDSNLVIQENKLNSALVVMIVRLFRTAVSAAEITYQRRVGREDDHE